MLGFNSAFMVVETTINAPPERVREVLLDFDNLPQWKRTQNLVHGVAIRSAGTNDTVSGIEAKPGDIAEVNSVQAGKAEAEVFVNTPTKFGYKGGKYGFRTHHWWGFLPSPEGAGKTTLKHCESCEGGLSCIFWSYSPIRWYATGLFLGFNQDLKAAVEGQVVEAEQRVSNSG